MIPPFFKTGNFVQHYEPVLRFKNQEQ